MATNRFFHFYRNHITSRCVILPIGTRITYKITGECNYMNSAGEANREYLLKKIKTIRDTIYVDGKLEISEFPSYVIHTKIYLPRLFVCVVYYIPLRNKGVICTFFFNFYIKKVLFMSSKNVFKETR